MSRHTWPNRVPTTTICHSPSSHLQESESEEEASRQKISKMIQKFDQDKDSSLKQIRGKDIPPCLLGYFSYAPVLPVVNLAKLAKELGAQQATFDLGDGILPSRPEKETNWKA
jgi:hypothetical protein